MKESVAQALNASLGRVLEADPLAILIGEDVVDPYGGTFKVTKGLSTRYPDRVRSTPISEGLITGMAAGMAMGGLHPIVEIMFGDFLTLCADQLVNHLAKYRWMFNDRVRLPLIIRTPMGGRRGYGPTHSQSLEKMFCGVPGLRLIAVNRFTHPGTLLERAAALQAPVLFIEHKALYPQAVADPATRQAAGGSLRVSASPFPTCQVSWTEFESADVTVVAYGGMADVVVEAGRRLMLEEEIAVEAILPTHIKPFDVAPMVDSVERSGRLAVFEEGTSGWGWGREVIYQVLQRVPEAACCAVARGARAFPIGNSKALEDLILPQAADVAQTVRQLMARPGAGAVRREERGRIPC